MCDVSVIIPCFNRATSIGRSIESALSQTVTVREVIVIDDGSTDDSAQVARTYGPLIRVERTPNGGAAAARNIGIQMAHGEWIAFLDSDDVWHPKKIEIQMAAAMRFPDVDLIFCDTCTYGADRQLLMPSRFGLGGLGGNEIIRDNMFSMYNRHLFSVMLESSRVITSAVMVRRCIDGIVFPEHIWGSEDWALWLKLSLRYRFAAVHQVLVDMFVGGDNLTGNISRLLRNDVAVLHELLLNEELIASERAEVERVLKRRRVGAVYHSLIQGECREAREMMAGETADIALSKRWLYFALSLLPSAVVRALAFRARASLV